MNLAQQNLITLEEEISSIINQLNNLNNGAADACTSIATKTVSPNDLSKRLADLFEAKSHQQQVLSDSMKSKIEALRKAHHKKTVFKEYRATEVMYCYGNRIKIYSPYYVVKGTGKKKNNGLMPAIVLLGIYKHCTEDMCSYISKLCSALSSYDEVSKLIKAKGINLNIKTIIAIAKQMALRARLAQQADDCVISISKGITIIISMDGGRVKIRETKRGPKTQKNRNRYNGNWREAKLFVIYLVDEKGEKIKHELPIIDGMIGSPEDVFAMLKGYLSNMDLNSFDNIVFIADGAPWIWKRAKKLILSLGVKSSSYTEILDYYHAMEHLNKLSKALFKNSKEQKKWVKECKKLLLNGDAGDFINKIKQDTYKKKGKKVTAEKNYFLNNVNRINYRAAKEKGLPLGSGSIESSIRRVINLRMKGNSIFWKHESANDMIFLRSFYKSGRWNELEDMAYKGGLQLAA